MKNTIILIGILLLTWTQEVLPQSQRSINEPLPARQVHLDFHTSELIAGIEIEVNVPEVVKEVYQVPTFTMHTALVLNYGEPGF